MKTITECKATIELYYEEVETIIKTFLLFLIESKKIQFLNNAKIDEFTFGLEKEITLYKNMLGLIGKYEEGNKTIQHLCNNVEDYFNEDEKLRFGIGQQKVVESDNLSEYKEEN